MGRKKIFKTKEERAKRNTELRKIRESLHPHLKTARRKTKENWRLRNKERVNQWTKNWILKNPTKAKLIQRKTALKAKYGISLEQYDKLFIDQLGRCAICLKTQAEFKMKFAVDHSHTNGKVCALLCGNCNTAIGLLKENPDTALRAVFYLHRHKI